MKLIVAVLLTALAIHSIHEVDAEWNDCYEAWSQCSRSSYALTGQAWKTCWDRCVENKKTPEEIPGFQDSLTFGGRTYMLSRSPSIDSKTSEAICGEMGGYLAQIENAVQNNIIKAWLGQQYLGNEIGALVGGTDMVTKGTYVFQFSGRTLSFFDWESGQPDNSGDCLQLIRRANYMWDDIPCDRKDVRFLCEVPGFQDSLTYGGRTYMLSSSPSIDSKTSEAICEATGGYLAQIENAAENNIIKAWLGQQNLGNEIGALVGGTDMVTKGTYVFQFPGRTLSFFDWESGQPDNSGDCLQLIQRANYMWDDIPCDRKDVRFLCEVPGFQDSLTYGGRTYMLSSSPSIDSKTSEAICEATGGYLAQIENAAENNIIKAWLGQQNLGNEIGALVGGTDMVTKGTYIFQFSGRTLSFFDWESGQPDNSGDCLQLIRRANYMWDDIPCDRKDVRFICEIP